MRRETANIRIGGENARMLNARSWPVAGGRTPRISVPLDARLVPMEAHSLAGTCSDCAEFTTGMVAKSQASGFFNLDSRGFVNA